MAALNPADLTQVDPALRAAVVAGFGPSLFAHLFEQARTSAAFTAASELVGLDRDTTDRLLTQTLHSVDDSATPRTIPAAEDWKEFLNGGFDSGEPVIVDALAGQRRACARPAGRHLPLRRAGFGSRRPGERRHARHRRRRRRGGGTPQPLVNPDRTEITFAPQTLQASSSVTIDFGCTGAAKVTLLWRIDNADPVVVPQSGIPAVPARGLTKLFKAARVVRGLKLDRAEFRYLDEVTDIAFDLDRLPVLTSDAAVPWSELAAFVDLLSLNRGVALKNQTLFEFFADSAGSASLEDVAELTGWKADDIEAVRNLFAVEPSFANPALWFVLKKAFQIIRRLDLRATQIQELLIDSPPSIAVAATVRNIFRAQFSQDAWK